MTISLQKKDIDTLQKRRQELDERTRKLQEKNDKLLQQFKLDQQTIKTINERLNQIDQKTEEEISEIRAQEKDKQEEAL